MCVLALVSSSRSCGSWYVLQLMGDASRTSDEQSIAAAWMEWHPPSGWMDGWNHASAEHRVTAWQLASRPSCSRPPSLTACAECCVMRCSGRLVPATNRRQRTRCNHRRHQYTTLTGPRDSQTLRIPTRPVVMRCSQEWLSILLAYTLCGPRSATWAATPVGQSDAGL
jgi:hypothetical protein